MITPDQIKKAAVEHAKGYVVYGTDLYTRSRNAFISGATWMQEQDQWISVEDKKPEQGQRVNFVALCPGKYMDGLVYAGTYVGKYETGVQENMFSTPGWCVGASYWKPSSYPPKLNEP